MSKSKSKTKLSMAVVAVVLMLATACGSGVDQAAPVSTGTGGTDGADTTPTPAGADEVTPTPPPTATPEDRGWIGGEPPFAGGALGAPAASGDAMSDDATAEAFEADGDESGADVAEDRVAETEPAPVDGPVSPEPAVGPLTGGSIDDNVDFDGYLAYRDRVLSLEIPVRDLDPTGRAIVTVLGDDELPVAGATVTITDGATIVNLTTTADGSVLVHPRAHGLDGDTFDIATGDTTGTVSVGEATTLVVADGGGVAGTLPIDILFLLDATGSMGDEIDQLKATISSVAARVGALADDTDVRLGMTLYRDAEDAFVTATFDFTSNIDAFDEALADVLADGGGDYPEALDEGLAEALQVPSWRAREEAIQLVFLVADAPPQVGRSVDTPYDASLLEAAERGIKIFPVSSSGTDDQAEYVFRQLAQFTGGRYVFLTYGAGGRATGEGSDITELDYEELALDDLIVRLVSEEISALDGSAPFVPEPTPTPENGN